MEEAARAGGGGEKRVNAPPASLPFGKVAWSTLTEDRPDTCAEKEGSFVKRENLRLRTLDCAVAQVGRAGDKIGAAARSGIRLGDGEARKYHDVQCTAPQAGNESASKVKAIAEGFGEGDEPGVTRVSTPRLKEEEGGKRTGS